MSTEQCCRLREAYAYARSRRETRVIVLMGGSDYFSNGIHLNVVEAAEDPAAESWSNLNAIDDLVRDIVETGSHLVISALGGDAGAGGVPLALAADYVVAREDVVLNPYYQHMGGLYGSEYWTYLLPRRVGPATTARLTGPPFRPVGTPEAVRTGLLDDAFGADLDEFQACTARLAERVAHDGLHQARLQDKRRRRALDERIKPLQAYRDEELARCHECFFGPDRSLSRGAAAVRLQARRTRRAHTATRYRCARSPRAHCRGGVNARCVLCRPESELGADSLLACHSSARCCAAVPASRTRELSTSARSRTGGHDRRRPS